MREAPIWCVVPPVIAAVGSVALFFYPNLFLNLARLALG
jgi:multicomponent Na+:H+ antiporter subunit D